MSEQQTNSPFHQPAQVTPNNAPAVARQVSGTETTPPSHGDSPQQRWQADRDAAAAADPWQDPNKVAFRGPDGGVQFKDRAPGDNAEPAKPGEPPKPGQAAVADNLLKLTAADGREFTLTAEDIAGLQERHALELSRKATLPADPAGYQVALPEGFKVEGGELTINPADPALADLRNFAHANGWSQQQFSDVLAIEAQRVARVNAQLNAARNAEIAKLGSAASQRIDAIASWWSSMTGDDGKVLGTILTMAPTAGTVKSFERLMQKWSSQGQGSFSGAGRDADESGIGPQKVDQATYDRMSYGEKMDYARSYQAAQERRR